MTAANDPFAFHREQLKASLHAAIDRVEYGYAAPMRQQIAAVESDEDILLPGLLCLSTAEAFGGRLGAGLGAATALALLGIMARVFDDIATEGPAGLEREWGMPRTLNAGDAFYAVAQALALDEAHTLGAEKGLRCIELIDQACHELSLEMHEGGPSRKSLQPVGAALGALSAGADTVLVGELEAFGRHPTRSQLGNLPAGVRDVLERVLPHLTNRS